MGYEYGNARVAAMRGRLLDRPAILRLSESPTMAALAAQLGRHEDWTLVLRQASAVSDAATALDTAIELHRSARWGVMPRLYDGRPHRLVEALVLPLDAERALALLRRRWAGEAHDEMAASVIAGALLRAGDLARMARAIGPAETLKPLVERAVLTPEDAAALAVAEATGATTAERESMLMASVDRSRRNRADGRGSDAEMVREMLALEQDDGEAIILELNDAGPTLATILERSTRLARLDGLAALGRRDPLGIGAVAGYVAAVEVQAVRLRAIIARVRATWSLDDMAAYFDTSERSTWLVSSS